MEGISEAPWELKEAAEKRLWNGEPEPVRSMPSLPMGRALCLEKSLGRVNGDKERKHTHPGPSLGNIRPGKGKETNKHELCRQKA